jgi:hypothetical protein
VYSRVQTQCHYAHRTGNYSRYPSHILRATLLFSLLAAWGAPRLETTSSPISDCHRVHFSLARQAPIDPSNAPTLHDHAPPKFILVRYRTAGQPLCIHLPPRVTSNVSLYQGFRDSITCIEGISLFRTHFLDQGFRGSVNCIEGISLPRTHCSAPGQVRGYNRIGSVAELHPGPDTRMLRQGQW